MADRIRKVQYFYTTVAHRAGEGARVLDLVRKARVNLLAFHGFPTDEGAQLDLFPEHPDALVAAARDAGIALTGPKTAFLIEGADRLGAVHELHDRLASAGLNVIAADAIAAGDRYGAIIWVAQDDVERAARVLGAA